MFPILFALRFLLNFRLDLFLYALAIQELIVQFPSVLEFSIILFNIEFQFHTIVVGNDPGYDFSILGFLKTSFVA